MSDETTNRTEIAISFKDCMMPKNAFPNLHRLSDKDLDTYLDNLFVMIKENNPSTKSISIHTAKYLLPLAIAEKNNRNALKLTKIAITVAASSVLVGAGNLIPAIARLF